jgi:excisionase family DNA binding protein
MKNATEVMPEFITLKEASQLLRVSKVTIHSYINRELFTCYKVGGRTLIEKSELLQALERRVVA